METRKNSPAAESPTPAVEGVRIGVIGLGYVGLPLACLFATKYPVVGFDMSQRRVDALRRGEDHTREVSPARLRHALDSGLTPTSDPAALADCNFYVVAVPTPVDSDNAPDLSCVLSASRTVAAALRPGDYVVYESTVYPGVTEDECVPVLEEISGLKLNKDFFVGYSPERINPGDSNHPVERITKITSGSTPEAARKIDAVYNSVLLAGTYPAPSIKVAEAAKVIENAQRDVNIAFMNELACLCRHLGIATNDVIDAAATKWNFLAFRPGLVGGHCIGVDPYYLIALGEKMGEEMALLKSARAINSNMGHYVAGRVNSMMDARGLPADGKVLVLGFTFKENCPDTRNTRVTDIVGSLEASGRKVTVFDPHVDLSVALREYGIPVLTDADEVMAGAPYDAVVYAVNHGDFRRIEIERLTHVDSVIYDVKNGLKGTAHETL